MIKNIALAVLLLPALPIGVAAAQQQQRLQQLQTQQLQQQQQMQQQQLQQRLQEQLKPPPQLT